MATGGMLAPIMPDLIGQDTLVIHDEAHLTPAFGDLLRALPTHSIKTPSHALLG